MKEKKGHHNPNERWWVFLVLMLLAMQVAGLYFFTFGFFPMKVALEGHATIDDVPSTFHKIDSPSKDIEPLFGKLIVMVVDALSAPLFFSESSKLTYTKSLIEAGKAFPFIAHAQAPTVTLPRIKALTSGGVPTFLDFLFNFQGQAFKEDNLITQFVRHQKKIVFYGDDTWLKLFPDHFYRFEGTTSFFVSDIVEVDNNVTRNVWPELEKKDWDIMILHYLGLDHVGHLQGPQSPLMAPKQQEMDAIVQRIHKRILERDEEDKESLPTLFLLCSDHGMNEMGNHGGSSSSETSSLFVFMSSLFGQETHNVSYDKTVSQIDLAPTLSLLFGQPIPRNSLGSLIAPLLQRLMSDNEYLRALQVNSEQLLRLLKASETFWSEIDNRSPDTEVQHLVDSLVEAQEYHKRWIDTKQASLVPQATKGYLEFLWGVKTKLAGLMSGEKDSMMVIGLCLMVLVLGGSVGLLSLLLWRQYKQNREQEREKHLLSVKKLLSVPHRFIIVGALLHLASLAGSSLVEEEHQTWYFLATTLHVLYLWESFKGCFSLDRLAVQKSVLYVGVLVLGRIERGWNQTGIKWLGNDDYGKWLQEEDNIFFLHCLNAIALCAPCIYVLFILERHNALNPVLRRIAQVLYICALLLLLSYRFKFWMPIPFQSYLAEGITEDVLKARLFYAIILCTLFIPFLPDFIRNHSRQRSFADITIIVEMWAASWILLLQILHRYHNLALLVMIALRLKLFIRALALHKRQFVMKNKYSTVEKDISLGILALGWMGSFSFFSLGNSNSLASIDISGAYTGLVEYTPSVVAMLTFIISYSGPFLSTLSAAAFLLSYFEELEIWQRGLRIPNNSKLAKMEGMLLRTFSRMNLLAILLWIALHSLHVFYFALLMNHFRHHLFIWSVFAPKFVYSLLWTILEVCKYLFFFVSSSLFHYILAKRIPFHPCTSPRSPSSSPSDKKDN